MVVPLGLWLGRYLRRVKASLPLVHQSLAVDRHGTDPPGSFVGHCQRVRPDW